MNLLYNADKFMGKEELEGQDPPEPTSLDPKREQKIAEFDELLDRSSLGSPAAKAIRARAPKDAVERVLARFRELTGQPEATVTPITKKKKR